ncbi:MAG TPA: 3D domain-containing protein [Kofleriaceae bacterium]|nr:3D domain-containing protein [Kofleriaceae bacterium]
MRTPSVTVRIVDEKLRRWARVAAPLLAAACSRADFSPSAEASPIELSESAAVSTPLEEIAPEKAEKNLGKFQLTLYHVADEDEVARTPPKKKHRGSKSDDVMVKVANDNTAAATMAAGVPDLVPLYDKKCAVLGNVSRPFAAQLALQGTGRLRDGRMLNVAGKCTCPRTPCFHVLPPHRKWGMGGSGQPLEPFRTVAVDPKRIKLGSLLYIPVLDGVRMPGRAPVGGFIHDGCVVAGDTGGGIQGAQLDLFVARRAYVQGLARRGGSHGWMKKIDVLDGSARCTRKGGKVSKSAAGSI